MSKFILLTKNRGEREKITTQVFSCLNYRILRIILLVAVVLVGLVYLALVTTTTQRGFTLDALRKNAAQLQEENIKLEREVARYESMPYLKELASQYEMVPTSKAEFIYSEGSVALTP